MAEPVTTEKPWSLNGMQGFINRTWKSRFVRNVAVVASGTLFSAEARGRKKDWMELHELRLTPVNCKKVHWASAKRAKSGV